MGFLGTVPVSGETRNRSILSGLGKNPEAEGDAFLPLLWDPIHPAAADVLQHTWEPVRRRLYDALGAVASLAGKPSPKLRPSEVAAFYFTLIKVLSSVVPMTEKRRTLFLQGVATHIYLREDAQLSSGSAQYWEFLNLRHRDYSAAAKGAPNTKPLISFIDHFLCHVGLGGGENADVVFGLYRYLSPLLAEATHILREAADRARGQADTY